MVKTIERVTIEIEMPKILLLALDSKRGAIPRNFFICDILKESVRNLTAVQIQQDIDVEEE